MIALFLDTNVLLHFKTFDEIAWSKITGGDCKLIIAPVVMDEIDKHKNNQNNKIAQRARMIASKFDLLIEGSKGKIPVSFIDRRPSSEYFDQNQLDPKHQDDCLMASILQYKSANSGINVMLVSDDIGVKLKCKSLGINIIKPDTDLRLPETTDKNAKEIEKLQKQLAELKERIPKVSIGFENNSIFFEKEVKTSVKTIEQYRHEEMLKLKREYPMMALMSANAKSDNPLEIITRFSASFLLSDGRRNKYNGELSEFYKSYERHLSEQYMYMQKMSMAFSLTFKLENSGTIPADDIDVWLHLPDGFTVSKDSPKKPTPPHPPYRPKNDYDFEPFAGNIPNLTGIVSRTNQSYVPDPDRPKIRKTNSYEVTYNCASLKHGLARKFEPVVLQYESFEKMQSFTIDYRLNIANVPQAVTGQLHVVINKTD